MPTIEEIQVGSREEIQANQPEITAAFDTCDTTGLDQQDIEKFGTLSDEQTLQALDALANIILREYPEITTSDRLTPELLQIIADLINTHFSFQFSGPGRATIPKQLVGVAQAMENTDQKLPTKGELSNICDCKLLTALLAVVLKKLGFGQDSNGLVLVRNTTSTHPGVLVRISIPEERKKVLYKVDFQTKFQAGVPEDTVLSKYTRHLTESCASIKPVSNAVGSGINKWGLLYGLDAASLARLDYHFLRM